MNYSNYRITLDVRDTVANVQLTAKKGDVGRKIYITLSDKGNPCEIADDSYAVFAGVKPDGTLLYNKTTIENNTIIYVMTQQTTAVAGLVACEVKLYDSMSNLLTSPKLTILVDDVVVPDEEIVSRDEVSALAELILAKDASVKTVNGAEPDESGNVEIPVVQTVNGTEPDENGNVEIPVVHTVNGTEPDESGNVEIPIVKTVNGIAPDENGNVEVSGGGSSVQSDWNQNDSTQPDYVKNRPFYTGDAIVETEICDINAMSKTALALWMPNDGLMTNGFATKESEAFIFDGIIEAGKRYVIVANGTKRAYVAEDGSNWNMTGTKMIGDVEAFASNDLAHLEMLVVIADAAEVLTDPSYDGKSIMYLAAFAGNTAPTEYKLYSREEEIIKLDPKYLPELPEYVYKPTKKVRLDFSGKRSSMTPTEIVNAVNLGFDVIFTDLIGSYSCRWWDISDDSIGLIASEDGYPVLYKIDSSGNLLRVNGLELKPTSGAYITNTSADQTYAKKSDLQDVSALVGTTPVSEQINTALGVIENGSY